MRARLLRRWQRAMGCRPASTPGLRERGFGEFEGLSFTQIEQRWPDQAEAWRRRDPDFGARGGEVLRDFRDRVLAAVTRLARSHRGQSIALVTHGGVLDLLYREATRVALDAPRTWQLANASINRLLHSGEGLVLVGWADVGHLEPAHDGAALGAPSRPIATAGSRSRRSCLGGWSGPEADFA